jgi:hypothetical protein
MPPAIEQFAGLLQEPTAEEDQESLEHKRWPMEDMGEIALLYTVICPESLQLEWLFTEAGSRSAGFQ